MEHTKTSKQDTLPKLGRVNEVCREWLVREDGALAYRLQSQEITEHYSGNKNRNAQVREDFPCALDEQIREQELAEQAAAVYQKMLAEQEEIDKQIARKLAEKLESEERLAKQSHEFIDETIARQTINEDKFRSADSRNNYPRRSRMMPLPNEPTIQNQSDLYSEPYRGYENVVDLFNRIDLADVGVPIDEVNERRIQEERDAELARQLQEQERSSEEFRLNRDRMMAIEAQDKELAKLLQERERAKVKRAKERAKQKALAKKQAEQIMPDDSYSNPIDLIPSSDVNYSQVINAKKNTVQMSEESNYSSPLDAITRNSYDTKQSRNYKSTASYSGNTETIPAIRPNQLELRSPLNTSLKTKLPEHDTSDSSSSIPSVSPMKLKNIAMAIDPTYTRRNVQSPQSFDTTSSTTSTVSSSPSVNLQDGLEYDGDGSPALPYMPIQGQRRTGSMEKKKKRTKDGCKQQ